MTFFGVARAFKCTSWKLSRVGRVPTVRVIPGNRSSRQESAGVFPAGKSGSGGEGHTSSWSHRKNLSRRAPFSQKQQTLTQRFHPFPQKKVAADKSHTPFPQKKVAATGERHPIPGETPKNFGG